MGSIIESLDKRGQENIQEDIRYFGKSEYYIVHIFQRTNTVFVRICAYTMQVREYSYSF